MSSTNKTTHYELPLFVDNDIFNPLVDNNDAMNKIDTALYNIANAQSGDASEITAIKSRVTSAEGDIDALETQAGNSVLTTTAQTLSGAINEVNSEADALAGRMTVVEDDINNVNTGLKVKVQSNTDAIASEVTNRENADTALGNRIDAEATARANAVTAEANLRAHEDDVLGDAIQSEITARTNADNALGARIDAEATTRANGDSVLAGNIANEAGARQSADANLQTQIDALIAPSGEAPSAAEVENARIGVDRSYSTLGDAIREQHKDTIEMLKDDGVYDLFSNFQFTSFGATNGVSATAVGQSTYVLNGTATADINFNIFANSSALIPNAEFDEIYLLKLEGDALPTGATFEIFRYRNGSWSSQSTFKSSGYVHLGQSSYNDTGCLIRWHIANGTVLNNVTVKLKLLTINPNNPVIYPVYPYSSADTINYCLNKYGKAIIAKGLHSIQYTITMPDNSRLTGYGACSILNVNAEGIDGIVVGANCTIDNVQIQGVYNASIPSSPAGIKISANYDTPPLIYETKLNNLKIHGFGFGILGEKTGYWVGCSISADNVEIYACYEGIKLWKHCEFVRFTNINSHDNDLGIRLQSGNNKFVNCSFSNNRINCYLDGYMSEGGDEGGNNGHGCFVGCDFNHANNNTGISILVKYITNNGFIFDGCNIWYGRVEVDEGSVGITISDCLFGGGTPTINLYNDGVLFLHDNLFKQSPAINKTAGTLIDYNNYLFDGTPVTT